MAPLHTHTVHRRRFLVLGRRGTHIPEHPLHDLYLGPLRGDDGPSELLDGRTVRLVEDGLGHRDGGLVVRDHQPQEQLVCEQLVEEGYVSVGWLDKRSDRYPWFRAAPRSLSTKGLIEIGELPDPDTRLAAALQATRRAIEQGPSIPEEEKPDMLDTLEKMATLANNVRGVAHAIIQGLGGGLG